MLRNTGGQEELWLKIEADEAGEAIVRALAEGGVEYLFFTSGSELVPLQEGIAKAHATGTKTPRLISVTHEGVNLSAALGYTLVTGKPSATVVHVDVGTLNYGAQLHTALRANLPILIMAGAPPTSYPGTYRGARDGGHFWLQQVPDQNGVVRQYVKWEHRLEWQDNPGLMISRALQVARSEPHGPVYMSLPREITMRELEFTSFPTANQLGIAVPPSITEATAELIARDLLSSRRPVAIASRMGRNPKSIELLAELADLVGMAVTDGSWRAYQCMPLDHPLYIRDLDVSASDFVLVIEADAPWVPGPTAPRADAKVVVIDCDPIRIKVPTMEFSANLRVTAETTQALGAIIAAVRAIMSKKNRDEAEARRLKWKQLADEKTAKLFAEAQALADAPMIQPAWLCYQIAKALDDSCIVLDETLPAAPAYRYLRSSGIGTYYHNPSSGGGWGPGAAFGAKLGRPDKDIVLVSGDGFYMYGVPTAALWAANHYNAPFLAIVFQNRSYNTGTKDVSISYPGGYAAKAGYEGGYFDPPIDLAKEAEAAGAYGETVRSPSEVAAALARGLAAIRSGKPAVLAFWLPRLLQDD